ncbi:7-carboxy-7-deazaguanine synthase [Parvularcula sp. LCG005]|uniref:7-carboxy-7-deazaguanine synthase n=1 Tax=Parvularcula sp. LCG005 TaxID=3078805 RepID=UPI0029434EA3|nr:7-carboxy-7-deazaguanine synthase [Parvularcula sp. LCG005]WOI53745.1 7-carboxy-7-deazaguanine synthase [Parvularcula sp. LCG005]
MTYSVKECFYTLQGEGAQTGRAAVFLRFAGCNLWNGLERDRMTAVCRFCDTDFVGVDGEGGGKFTSAEALSAHVATRWPGGGKPYVVCTGGEPLLQLDRALIDALHAAGFEIAVETNGTIAAPDGIDWVCVSPKADAPLVQRSGHELKLVFPQAEDASHPSRFEQLDFRHFFLQPMDGEAAAETLAATLDYCRSNPQWRLSLQTHKLLGIP